uniref:F-box domain-containing protein n=1 Tax=Manihot esculenta TaxID=3983 RepID=A0A2C9WBE9_MANES
MSAIRSMIIRSRSHRVVQDGSAAAPEVDEWHEEDTSCWANMPEELLREVLLRIEASESSWPPRKSVVACAGVCRTWRQITKELVKVPEVSGRLTFPISVKQPGPRDFLLQCFIKRCRSTQTYYLYLSLTNALADDGKFLLAAHKCRRPTFTDYLISLDAGNMSKGSSAYVGKLRSNFLGTKFTVFDGQRPHAGAKMTKSRSTKLVNLKQISPRVPAGSYPVAHISYELNVLGSRGPRRMQCIMDAIPFTSIEPGGVAPTQIEFSHHNVGSFPSLPFFRSKSNHTDNFLSGPLPSEKDGALVLKNKAPRKWTCCWSRT